MAIRKLNLLATSEIAEAPFRSLQEIDDYLTNQVKKKLDELDGLLKQYQLQFSRLEVKSATEFIVNKDPGKAPVKRGKFKIDKLEKVVIPKLDTLRQNFSIVDELAEQADALEALYNSTAFKFRGMRGLGETLKNIRAMQRNAQVKVDKALAFLKTIGEKYAPEQFKKFVQEVMTTVQTGIEFKDAQQFLYASESKASLTFTYYIKLRGLRDDVGDIYPYFFLVFTCILVPSTDKKLVEPHYYVTVMHEFATPGKFMLGRQVDSVQAAVTTLGAMLDLENVGSGIGTMPHGLDPDKWTKNKFSMKDRIASFKVDEGSFYFEFLSDVDDAEAKELIQKLYLEVKAAWKHVKEARIKVKPKKTGRVNTVLFTLTNLATKDKVSTTQLDFLKEHLGLDDDKLRAITRILNND